MLAAHASTALLSRFARREKVTLARFGKMQQWLSVEPNTSEGIAQKGDARSVNA